MPILGAGFAACLPTLQAPEVLDGGQATAAGDVYSFGIVLHEARPSGLG